MKRLALLLVLAAACFGADLTGRWTAEVVTDAGSGNPSFEFKQEGSKLTGAYSGQLGEAKVTGTVEGQKVSFSFTAEAGGQSLTVRYEGTIENDNLVKGKVDLGGMASGSFTLTRK